MFICLYSSLITPSPPPPHHTVTSTPHIPPILQESFVRARSWVQELQRYAKPNIIIALAGNKADLAGGRTLDFEVIQWLCYVSDLSPPPTLSPTFSPSLSSQVAQLYADENELLFMETSAKTDMNVSDIFTAIGDHQHQQQWTVFFPSIS